MTTRPARDWSPLSRHDDPVPGDPMDVSITGRIFSQTADAAGEAAAHLRRLQSGDQQCSEAIEKIRTQAGEAAGDLDHVKIRYAGAATALMEYGEVLRDAQDKSLRALDAAGPSAERRRKLDYDLTSLHAQAQASTDPQQRQVLVDHLVAVKSQRDAAIHEVTAAKQLLQAAIDERNEGAGKAKQLIDEAVSTSGFKDSPWDKFVSAMESDQAQQILEMIAWGLVIAAIIVSGGTLAYLIIAAAAFVTVLQTAIAMHKAYEKGDTAGVYIALGIGVLSLIPGGRFLKGLKATKFFKGKFLLASQKELGKVAALQKAYRKASIKPLKSLATKPTTPSSATRWVSENSTRIIASRAKDYDDAVRLLQKRIDARADGIKSIVIGAAQKLVEQGRRPQPTNHSIPLSSMPSPSRTAMA